MSWKSSLLRIGIGFSVSASLVGVLCGNCELYRDMYRDVRCLVRAERWSTIGLFMCSIGYFSQPEVDRRNDRHELASRKRRQLLSFYRIKRLGLYFTPPTRPTCPRSRSETVLSTLRRL